MSRYRRAILLLVIAVVDAGIVYLGVHKHSEAKNPPPPVVITLPTHPTKTAAPVALTQSAAHVQSATTYSEPNFSVFNADVAWHSSGYCSIGGAFLVTGNAGTSYSNVPPPAPFIIYMHLTGVKTGWVIGSDINCYTLTRYSTTDAGAHWKTEHSLGKVWIPVPVGVRGANGKLTSPCGNKHAAPVSFSSAGPSGTAIVVCRRGTFRSTNGGTSWSPIGDISAGSPASVALAPNGKGVLLMTGDVDGCKEGTRVLLTDDAGATWTKGECLRVAKPPIAIGFSDAGQGLLLTLTSRYRSTDYGRTWG